MAENVASTTTADASNVPPSDLIFTNTSFWVGHQIPQRAWLLEKMRTHGATIVALESQADIRLIDDAKGFGPYLNGDYFSFRFIEDSIRKGIQQPLQRYRVSASSQTQAIQGKKGILNRRTRTKFTEEDDRILFDAVMPIKNFNGPWRGIQIYKHLAQKYPHHTFQSWRSRFVDHLQYRHPYTNRPFTRSPEPDPVHEEVAPAIHRSPKRRRLQNPEESIFSSPRSNVNAQMTSQAPLMMFEPAQQLRYPNAQSEILSHAQLPDDQERTFEQEASTNISADDEEDAKYASLVHLRQSLLIDPELKNTILKRGFTLEQANSFYKAVPHICDTEPERLDACWNEMAVDYDIPPMHSAEEWKVFWSEVILPAYMKRNELSNEDDLRKHIGNIFNRETKVSTPKIKIEPIVHSRTPEDVQRERELARARAEAELQLSSEDEDDGINNCNDDNNRMNVGTKEKELSSAATHPEESYLFYPPSSPVLRRTFATVSNDNLETNQDRATKNSVTEITQDFRPSPKSPKKKLFGRSLQTEISGSQNPASQSVQVQIQSEVQTEKIRTALTVISDVSDLLNGEKEVAEGTLPKKNPRQKSIDQPQNLSRKSRNTTTVDQTKVVELLHPATQQSLIPRELPKLGQRLPKSITTSQSTAQVSYTPSAGDVAINVLLHRTVTTKNDTNTSTTNLADASHAGEENEIARINLIDEGVDDEDETHSETAASDTGSEFMAFDEEPERSQLWTHPAPDDTSAERDGEAKEMNENSVRSLTDHNKDGRRDSTKLLRIEELQANPDQRPHEQLSHDSRILVATTYTSKQKLHQVETQDLFQATFEGDPSLLDIPPPDGGWEELGVDETEYEEFDTVIRTTETSVELDDEDVLDSTQLARGPSYYASGENATLSSRSFMANRRTRSASQDLYQNAVIDISSDSFSDTESTVSSSKASSRATIGRDADETETEAETETETETETESAASSESDDSPPREESRIADLQNWFGAQRTRYITLPNQVFHRLASAAAQAATLNLPTAALVLRIMTERYTSSETAHRQQCRERNRSFKPKEILTENEARKLVPGDTWGVWTIADDSALLSRTVEGVRDVEVKHGVEGTRRRTRFLRARYAAPEAGTRSVGREVARQALLEGKARPKPKAGLRDMVI